MYGVFPGYTQLYYSSVYWIERPCHETAYSCTFFNS